MLPKDLTQDIKIRLTTIRGQVEGLIKMLENEKDPDKIITQFKAVNSGLVATYNFLLDEVYRKALAMKIVEVVDTCPGNCGNENRIQRIKEQFPHLALEDLSKAMREITDIGVQLKKN